MRDAFVGSLIAAMRSREDVLVLSGDLGFGVFNELQAEFPDRFHNVGVAEQAMMGMAAGLAMAGHHVIAYSIANFVTLRCLEQIRNDVAYHGADVTIVGVGGGFAYGNLGMSHHATSDIAAVRALGGVSIVVPADPAEARVLFQEVLRRGGPTYFRLGRNGEPSLGEADGVVRLGRPRVLRSGTDVTLVAAGPVAVEAVRAAELLASRGVDASVVSVNSLGPGDAGGLAAAVRDTRLLVTVEEHLVTGGLGSLMGEVLAEEGWACRLVRLGVPATGDAPVGSQNFMREACGISASAIADRVVRELR